MPSSAPSSQSSHKAPAAAAAPARVGLGHPSVRKGLSVYALVLGMTVATITVLIWTFGTLYWGSLYQPQEHLYRLTAVVINRDGNGAIGQAVSSGLLALNSAASPHMTYSVVDGSAFPTQADVDEAVHYKLSTWLAIEVAENASQQLQNARQSGNASWDPTSVITVTYVQARNQATVDGQVLAFFRPAITQIVAQLNAQLAASYLSSVAGNAAAIQALAAAPQTIGAPVGLTYRNLAMYPTVANAATFVGLIYLCILAFNVTMAGGAIRDAFGLDLKLTARSQVLLRLGGPFLAYIVLSLMWSLLELPFHLPFGGNFSHGAGFMVWWMFTLLGMAVLGYWTEGFYALVGPKWVAYSLLVIILTNVSGANLAVEAQNVFYKFSYAMPFYVTKSAYLNILFHVGYRAELAKSFGILMGWLILSLLTIPIWLRLERKRLLKAKAAGPPGPPAKKPDEKAAPPHDSSA